MNPNLSVTHWLNLVQEGDPQGAQRLWERYFAEMVRLARARLAWLAPVHANEEDVALSAFATFCRHAENGRFPKLADRDDLWRLLVVITARKARQLIRDERRFKRHGNRHREELNIEAIVGDAPTPEFAAQCADECQLLIQRLNDHDLIQVALLKMEGFTNPEIAEKQGCAPRTIERRLRLIRHIWESECERGPS